jgi:cytoskeletal protein CcmA (bactofilin family)
MEQGKGTRIGKSLVIRGEISGSENILLDGIVDGGITLTEGCLSVGLDGHAKANVVAREVVVSGRIDGNITATDRAEFHGTASFTGHLIAPRLSIQGDARLKGSIDLTEGRLHKTKPAKAAPQVKEEQVEEFESDPALV